MANSRHTNLLLFFTIICAAHSTQGSRAQIGAPYTHSGVIHFPPSQSEFPLQGFGDQWRSKNSRRMMIGSTSPTCTYSECRGCKYKCRAEQVPVEGNDPINSAYHYRCVCHR